MLLILFEEIHTTEIMLLPSQCSTHNMAWGVISFKTRLPWSNPICLMLCTEFRHIVCIKSWLNWVLELFRNILFKKSPIFVYTFPLKLVFYLLYEWILYLLWAYIFMKMLRNRLLVHIWYKYNLNQRIQHAVVPKWLFASLQSVWEGNVTCCSKLEHANCWKKSSHKSSNPFGDHLM